MRMSTSDTLARLSIYDCLYSCSPHLTPDTGFGWSDLVQKLTHSGDFGTIFSILFTFKDEIISLYVHI